VQGEVVTLIGWSALIQRTARVHLLRSHQAPKGFGAGACRAFANPIPKASRTPQWREQLKLGKAVQQAAVDAATAGDDGGSDESMAAAAAAAAEALQQA
jgi:hypothetical protein